jgi:hypothetical protein
MMKIAGFSEIGKLLTGSLLLAAFTQAVADNDPAIKTVVSSSQKTIPSVAAGLRKTAATPPIIGRFPTPSTQNRGLAFDGTNLWAADDGNRIYKLNPNTGAIIATYTGPGTYPCGLTWDGTYLWCSDFGTNMIYKFNPVTMAVVSSFSAGCDYPFGLAWDGNFIYMINGHQDTIFRLDPATGARLDTIVCTYTSPNRDPIGLVYMPIGPAGQLWTSDAGYGSNLVSQYDLSSDSWVDQWAATPTTYPCGLAYDPKTGRLWVSCWNLDSIFVYQSTPVDTVNIPHISISPRSFKVGPTYPAAGTLNICNTGKHDTLQYTIDSVAGGRVVADTASGRLDSGACRNVILTFNRAGLSLGNNIFQLRVRHNALLDTNPVSVACTLFVDSAMVPHIALTPGSFHVGPAYPAVQTLQICNSGTQDTLQYSIDSVAGRRIVADTATGSIPATGCKNVQLTFNRSGLPPGNNIIQLLVRHNSPLSPNPLSVACTLAVDSASVPHIALTPGSFHLRPTDTTVQMLNICNTVAADTLRYTLNLGSGNILVNEVCNIDDYIELLNTGSTDVNIGGYRLVWTDNSASSGSYTIPVGTIIRPHRCVLFHELTGTGSDSVFYMGINIGWVQATDLSVSLLNGSGIGVDFFKTSGDATSPPTGTTWSGSGVTAGYYAYRRSTTIDNNNAADWTAAASSADYSWCVLNPGQTSFTGGGGIISADTATGSVAAGGCRNVLLTFNRTGLLPGPNVFQFTVTHNSPLSPNPLSVACTLEVDSASVPHIAVSPGSFHIGPTDTNVKTLQICDTSTHDTLQYSIDTVAGRRIVADTAAGRLAAGACRNVTLTFNRAGLPLGNTIVQLVIRHNGPLEPNPLSVPCTLYVDSASVPHIALTPGSYLIGPKDTLVQALQICNSSIHDTLHYSIAGNGSKPNIVAWTYGAELTYRYPNTVAAIRQRMPLANITATTTTAAATLSALLQTADVFLIPAQYNSTPTAAVGTAFRPVLDSFVRRGGIVIAQQPYWEYAFLTASGLDSITYENYTSSTTATVTVPADPVFDSISAATFTMPVYTGYWTGSALATRLATYAGYAVCTKQIRGSGVIYLLGADLYNTDATWTRMLDNCIIQNLSGGPVSADTAAGVVAAGGCRTVQLTFSRTGLLPGTNVFKLRVRHDSPLSPDPLSVACTLTVDSTTMAYMVPSMSVTIYTGDTAMRYVTLQNTGSSILMDSVIKISHGVPVSGTILINEVSNEPDYIELLNTGSTDVNIGNWRLVWTDNVGSSSSFTIAAGTVIRAHRCVLFAESTTGTPSDSVINMGIGVGWVEGTQLSVSLLNNSGTGVDFFKTSGDAATPPAGTTWTGSGFATSGSAYYYYRLTTADNNNSADWGQGGAANYSPTYCLPNPGQSFGSLSIGYITAMQDSFHIDGGQSSLIRFKYDASTLLTGGIFIDTFQIIQNSKNVSSPITVVCTLRVISNIPVLIPVTPDPTVNRRPELSWHPVTSASLYTVEASLSPSFSTLAMTQQTADTMIKPPSDLPLGMLYWRVQCDLSIRYSLPDNFYLQNDSIPLLIPLVPDTLRVQTSTLFTWHPSTGATSYRIVIYDIDSTVLQTMLLAYVNDTSYLYAVPLPTSTYLWTVSANFDYTRTAYPDTFWVNTTPVLPAGEQLHLPTAYGLKASAAAGHMRISCAIPRQNASRGVNVVIDMFDMRGKLVRVLFSGTLTAGYHPLNVTVESFASGIYFCRMRAGSQQRIAPVHLMR